MVWQFSRGAAGASAAGSLLAGGLLFLLQSIYPKGMGGGDVKMAAGIGAWLGPAPALQALWFSFLFGGAAAVGLWFAGKVRRKDALAFGPYLALGAFLSAWGSFA